MIGDCFSAIHEAFMNLCSYSCSRFSITIACFAQICNKIPSIIKKISLFCSSNNTTGISKIVNMPIGSSQIDRIVNFA